MKYLIPFCLMAVTSFAQIQYPKDYFRLPLNIPLELSGCFGELRNNHFHSGFDIKTQQREGLPVFAVAEGYVSRIKIATFGYGKAIYVTHPNGFTTVYGHLSKGYGKIEKKIKKMQYKQELYEVDFFLKPDELPIQKNDTIAFSGNTGGSGGPHLHFEFRETATEKILNPMLFGFDQYIKDHKKPILNNVLIYPIDEKSVVNQSNMPIIANLTLQKDGSYWSDKVLASGKLGFAINAYDMFSTGYNKYGVYKVVLKNNEKPLFSYQFDGFTFDQFRYINAFLDYNKLQKSNQRYQKLFMKTPFDLKLIETDSDHGMITTNDAEQNTTYTIEISDFHQNTTRVKIPVMFDVLPVKNNQMPDPSPYFINQKREQIFEKDQVEVTFPKGVFYDNFNMNFQVSKDTLTLHNKYTPVHQYFSIKWKLENPAFKDLSKVFIAQVEGRKLDYLETTLKNNVLYAKSRELGTYVLAQDTIAPKIGIAKSIEGKNIARQKNITLTISDNLSGIKTFHGYLNNQWILFEYEYKNKSIVYQFDDRLQEGENKLKVIVTDYVGNSTTFETSFQYQVRPE